MAKSVCVIGAGVAGITALRYLTENPAFSTITAYEQGPDVGGTWVYTDRVCTDEHGLPLHTSMYKYLRTNIPKELMALEGFSMPKELHSYIGHEDYLKYIRDCCDHFNLRDYIKFNTRVCKVTPLVNGGLPRWKVKVKTVGSDVTEEHDFDAVVVCNGHFSVPFIPEIPGMDTFPGTWLHSHDFRIPQEFKDQSVVVVGGSQSGQDIALQISAHAKQVYMSHRNMIACIPKDKVLQVALISTIDGNKLVLKDNTELHNIDSIIFCTGYHYSFEFLDESCCPDIEGNKKVSPLYQHILHVEYPTLAFLGLPVHVPPTQQFVVQAKFVASAFSGKITLPTKEEMYKHVEALFGRESPGADAWSVSPMSIHKSQWDYYDELADLGKFDKLPKVVEKLFKLSIKRMMEEFLTFRSINYEIVSDTDFIEKR